MKRLLPIALVLPLLFLACRNLILLSRDMVTGDGSAQWLIPRPVYPLARLPATPTTLQFQAAGRIGSDFAQVYFPARADERLQDAYDHARTLDPWGRPSRYAPAVLLLCRATICRMEFGYASLLNILIQVLLFYLVLHRAFVVLGATRYFPLTAVFVSLALFLTPVGLSWFERGQFSLYVATSMTLLLLGFTTKKPAFVALAAALAFVKWTALGTIGILFVVYLLSSRDRNELKLGLVNLGVFGAVTAALLLVPIQFVRGTGMFLSGLAGQELRDNPSGLSLLKYAPRALVKLLPLVLVALGFVHTRKSNTGPGGWMPFALGVAILMVVYPTRASDYSAPALLGFAPFMFVMGIERWPRSARLAKAVLYAYGLFMAIASFSTQLTGSLLTTTALYVVFSVIFMASSFALAMDKT